MRTIESSWVTVCPVSELIDDVGVRALIGDRQVAIFKVTGSDRLYAIDAIDPFCDAPVLSRGIVGDVQGTLVVASPMYKQHFSLETGACLEDPAMSVETFSVGVIDGWVNVSGGQAMREAR